MVSKKFMIGSIITTLICLALGIACVILKPDVVSYVLLGVVVLFALAISVSIFLEMVAQNKEAKAAAADKASDETVEEVPAEETPVADEAPVTEDAEKVEETETSEN